AAHVEVNVHAAATHLAIWDDPLALATFSNTNNPATRRSRDVSSGRKARDTLRGLERSKSAPKDRRHVRKRRRGSVKGVRRSISRQSKAIQHVVERSRLFLNPFDRFLDTLHVRLCAARDLI